MNYKYHFTEKESDITIISESKKAINRAEKAFFFHRRKLEEYVLNDKEFLESFSPVKVNTSIKIIEIMAMSAELCDVGPMAAVAGAIADLMLNAMKKEDRDTGKTIFHPVKNALVENGGEIAIDSEEPMRIALYAGMNPLNLNLGFLVEKNDCPLGIGTSSATIGHAISLGQSDAVTVFAKNAAIGDAAATKVGNLVKGNDIEQSIKRALDFVDDSDFIDGAFISREDKIGQTGKIPKMFKIQGDHSQIIKEKIEGIYPDNYKIFK